MTYDYDKLYADTPGALGPPTPDLMRMFKGLPPHRRILDLGCGQGRDALPLARLGHLVTAIDLSPHGIAALNTAARAENLPITAHAADITQGLPPGPFDVLLIDRTLHMLPEAPRLSVLAEALGRAAPGALLILADERANMPAFEALLDRHLDGWTPTRLKPGLLTARRAD